MLAVGMLLLACLMAGLLRFRSPPDTLPTACQRALLFWAVGIQGVLLAYGHTGVAAQTAAAAGWPAGSPFQYELAMAHLAIGFLGLSSEWFPSFRLPASLAYLVFAVGSGVGVLTRTLEGAPLPSEAALTALLNDALLPMVLLILALKPNRGQTGSR